MRSSGREAEPRLRLASTSAPVGRPALSFAFSALATAALVPAFALFAPQSAWSPLELVLALSGIALVTYLGALVVDRSLLFDSGVAVALVAVVFCGPLPAACIWIGTELVAWCFERHRPGPLLSTVASFGWAALAAGFVLDLLVPGGPGAPGSALSYGAVALAGVVMLGVNFFVGPGSLHALRYGKRVSEMVRGDLVAQAPATLPLVAGAVLAVFLYAEVGVFALVLFALLSVLPQLILPALLAPRPVRELEHSDAVALYAQAIADEFKLGRKTRLVLRDAAYYIRERPLTPREGKLSDISTGHRLAIVETVLYYKEHWDGIGGFPGAVGGEMIPLCSRVLAVADAWGGLTAKGSPELTHSQALNQIEARAGMHFDPLVVAGALKVVEDQRLDMPVNVAYQPRLQHLALPEFARRALEVARALLAPAPEGLTAMASRPLP